MIITLNCLSGRLFTSILLRSFEDLSCDILDLGTCSSVSFYLSVFVWMYFQNSCLSQS